MEIPAARIVRVQSASPPKCLDTTADGPGISTLKCDKRSGRASTPADEYARCISSRNSESSRSSALSSVFQSPVGAGAASLLRDSASTTPALREEEEVRRRREKETAEHELAQVLDWFRSTFTSIGSRGCVTLRDFKVAARDCEGFAENLFKLFDTDRSSTVSLQELLGGMGRLTIRSKKTKILKWFEHTFVRVAGDDQLLQLDEFQRALALNGFIERFFQLMDHDDDRQLTLTELLDAFGKLTCMDRDAKWLAWIEQQFSLVAGCDRQIDFQEFKSALHVKESFFAERFFQLFDKDNSGWISLRELVDGLILLTNGSVMDKLRFLFQVYDMDGNGYIDFEELRTVLKSCMDESMLHFSAEKLDELTRALFEDADADRSGTISFEELQAELDKHPGVMENLSISAAKWLNPPVAQRKHLLPTIFPHWLSWRYIRNNLVWVTWIVLHFAANSLLFVEAAVRHRENGPAVAIARGCGQCLNFNPVLVVLLMMRRGLTWLRSTRLAFLFPLDHFIELHKLTGWMIFSFSILHFLAHTVNFTLLSMTDEGLPMWKYFFYWKTGVGWVFGTAGITGEILLIILVVMVICALPCVRRRGFFEVFYYTHYLFVPWFVVLVLHATHFWKWFLVPGLFYVAERVLRSRWVKLVRYGRTYIQEGILLPSRVIHLVISRPSHFSYQPGDYIFIQIPAITKYEWHPFTISSAPEQQGCIWLHIRAIGTWSQKLYQYFDERNQSRQGGTLEVRLPKDQTRRGQGRVKTDAWEVGSCDLDSMSDTHPMAVTHTCDQFQHSRQEVESLTHGQDFSHVYAQPTTINVQLDDREDKGLEVLIDGPYGTPSAQIFQAEHAVLIGAGIGVTPFASILQSVVMRYRNARQVCPRCNHGWTGEIPSSVMRLRKVDFYWINRDQRSFEWFVSLLSQLEIEQNEQSGFERFLDMHMYMTAALRKTDMKALGLQMALDLIHKKEKRDLITGLKTRTQAGRPDWEKVFNQLDDTRRGKVTVFFCGPPAIVTILKAKCAQHGFEFHHENF